jgi:hypothetical protein
MKLVHTNLIDQEAMRWNAFYNSAWAMREFGSDFEGALADLYYKADKTNKAKLEDTFLDVFMRHMDNSDRKIVSRCEVTA